MGHLRHFEVPQEIVKGGVIISESRFDGKIIRAVGGNYYVDALDRSRENVKCAARGIFRLDGISPCAGDNVLVSEDESGAVICEIYERKNYLVRPPLANLDGIVFVIAGAEPSPNRFILDKLLAIADSKGIEPMIAFTKADLKDVGELMELYRMIGIAVCSVDNMAKCGAEPVMDFIRGRVTAFIGNSGVGKSSLLNTLFPDLSLETADISKKLGRGRHTTRQVELYRIAGGYTADTPGFSTVDTERYCRIAKGQLAGAFREFSRFVDECEFADCAHVKERGCAVKSAVLHGEIAESRYDSYLRMYEEAAKINEWEQK